MSRYLLLAATDISNIPLAVYETERAAVTDAKNWTPEIIIMAARRQQFQDTDPAKVETIALEKIGDTRLIDFVRNVRDFRIELPVKTKYVVTNGEQRVITIDYDGRVTIHDPNDGVECDTDLNMDDNTPAFFAALRDAIDQHLQRVRP